jgi:hypothetical protein
MGRTRHFYLRKRHSFSLLRHCCELTYFGRQLAVPTIYLGMVRRIASWGWFMGRHCFGGVVAIVWRECAIVEIAHGWGWSALSSDVA